MKPTRHWNIKILCTSNNSGCPDLTQTITLMFRNYLCIVKSLCPERTHFRVNLFEYVYGTVSNYHYFYPKLYSNTVVWYGNLLPLNYFKRSKYSNSRLNLLCISCLSTAVEKRAILVPMNRLSPGNREKKPTRVVGKPLSHTWVQHNARRYCRRHILVMSICRHFSCCTRVTRQSE